MASYFKKKLISTNHAVGHIELSALLTDCADPVTLLVSGGHTMITAFSEGRWRVFGETLDLTIGQLIDQFGRTLKYSSPCGKKIEALAAGGKRVLELPYTVKGNDVSLSGILTASSQLLRSGYAPEDVAHSIQETAFSMLAEASERAIAFTGKKEFMVVGGVAANKSLRDKLEKVCKRQDSELFVPPVSYTGDCGAQIAWTGLLQLLSGQVTEPVKSVIRQSWRLDEVDCPWRN
jgi:N6-L-threonylcarbamoyladenine synthase